MDFPSLQQGTQFRKRREGFSLSSENNQVIQSNDYSSQSQQQTIQQLRQEYQNAVQLYQTLENKLSNNISGYFSRTNTATNPYLNKTIQFTDGTTAYVTNQGVVKMIPSTEIMQSLQIPTNVTAVQMPWSSNYKIPGTTIPTNPPLISGTPMKMGQSVGNEGTNLFVNTPIPSTTAAPSYLGCYAATNNTTTFIGETPSGSSSGSYTYAACQAAAVGGGYQYFGLQNVNTSTGMGYCAVSNDISQITANGNSLVVSSTIQLWSSGNAGVSAILTTTGALQVVNSSGKAVYSSPATNANPSNYFGCYNDASAMTMYENGAQQYSNSQCQQIAQQNGYDYYGLQNSTSGTNAQCALSNNFSQATQYGAATNCTKLSDGSWSGGGLSNAIYSTTGGTSGYYLLVEDNGNMGVYRGSGPDDNQGLIWETGTGGKAQDANPSMVASLGKYGQNYMLSGFTLAPNDFVGSNSGTAALVMNADGNLELVTYQMTSNCQAITVNGTDQMGGGVNANAMYDMGIKADTNVIGMLGYVDADSNVHTYPSGNQQYTNNYTTVSNATSSGNDIQGASFSNATIDSCQSACNENDECGGFVYDTNGNTCTPKTSQLFGSTMTPDATSTVYVRGLQPSNGVSQTTNVIDSVTYSNYLNKGVLDGSYNRFGLAGATYDQTQELSQLEDIMNMLSNKIASLTSQFQSGMTQAQQQSQSNASGVDRYLSNIKKTQYSMKQTTNGNVQGLLNDSDIIVLQENYKYLFWSILAAATVLISMNIMRP